MSLDSLTRPCKPRGNGQPPPHGHSARCRSGSGSTRFTILTQPSSRRSSPDSLLVLSSITHPPPNMKVANKIFFIFGGASGLGEATARLLHSQGAYVAILDLNEDLAESVATSLNTNQEATKMSSGMGPTERALHAAVDICDTQSIEAAFALCDDKWKDVEVGGAVVASGIGMVGKTLERDGSPHNLDVFEQVIKVNLTGNFNACRLVAARLVRDVPKPIPAPTEETPCRGVIVTVASQAGLEGQAGQVAYATSKGAVVSMTLPMAR